MDGRPNRRNKAAFSNFSGVLCTPSRFAVMIFNTSVGANSSRKSTDSLGGNVPIFGVILNTPCSSRVLFTCDDVTEGCASTPGGIGHLKNGL